MLAGQIEDQAGIARVIQRLPRDHGCRFPGCTNHRFVDAHHIEHWARGGETTLGNLVQLCRRHHRLLHEGGFTVEQRPGGRFRFRRPDGRPVPGVPAVPRGRDGEIRTRNRRSGLRVGPETCFPLSAGDRMDLDLAVSGLFARAGPGHG